MLVILSLILIIAFIYCLKCSCDRYGVVLWTTNFEMHFSYLLLIPVIIIFFISIIFNLENYVSYFIGCYSTFAIVWVAINSYENNDNWWKSLIATIVRILISTIIFVVIVCLLLGGSSAKEENKDEQNG